MIQIRRKDHRFLQPALIMALITIGTQIQILISQSLSAGIGAEYLSAFSMLNYSWLLCQVVGFSLGETCYILISRDDRRHHLRQYLGGASLCYLVFLVLFAILAIVFEKPLLNFLEVENLPDVHANFLLWIGIAALFGLSSVFLYVISIVRGKTELFIIEAVALTVSSTLGVWATQTFTNDVDKFFYLNFSLLISWILSLGLCLYFLKGDIRISWRSLKIFVTRAKHMIVGESILQSLILVTPLFYSVALHRSLGGESLAAYNVAFRILEVFIVIQWSIGFYGVRWICEIMSFRGEPEWFYCLRKINHTSILIVGLPLIALVQLLPFVLDVGFNLKSEEASLIGGATLLSLLPSALTAAANCKIKAFEHHMIKAAVNAGLIFGIGLPAVSYFDRDTILWGICGIGLLLPSILEGIWLFFYDKYRMPDEARRRPAPATLADPPRP